MRALVMGISLIALACAGAAGAGPRAVATRGPLEVTASLERARFDAGEPVLLSLAVRNAGRAPLVLEFASGQRVDYVIRCAGREIWRWSADRAFTMALGTMTLAPGEERTYAERWPQATTDGRPAGPGTCAYVGILTTMGRSVEAGPVEFTIVRKP